MLEMEEKALTWEDLAEMYDLSSPNRPARTLPMDYVFAFFEKQRDKYQVLEDGTIHRLKEVTPR